MTDTTGSNTAATEGSDGHNVIAVSFEDDRNAYEALTSLKELDSQQRVGVGEAVVVERGQDGQVVEKDRVEELKAKLHHRGQTETDDAERAAATAGSTS